MRQIEVETQYAAVGVDEAEVARLACRVREESRIAVGNRSRLRPHWDPMITARNKWIYEKAMRREPWKNILTDLAEEYQRQDWQPIRSVPGIVKAASDYAKRSGLPTLPKRKQGRPPSTSSRPEM
jgi:hypothetical protein